MNWIKNLFSKSSPKKHVTNSNSGKSFDEMYQALGVFNYDNDGFTITYEGFVRKINWAEITQLNVFKVDQITIDRIEMEIVYGDKRLTINEELPGWYQFVVKTKEVFSSIPRHWDIKIIQPAFATNYRTIYEKENTITE